MKLGRVKNRGDAQRKSRERERERERKIKRNAVKREIMIADGGPTKFILSPLKLICKNLQEYEKKNQKIPLATNMMVPLIKA